MKVLFVNACVRDESRTLYLCREYIKKHLKGCQIEQLDLENLDIAPLSRERLRQRDLLIEKGDYSDKMFCLAHKFAEADLILVGAPFWDCSFPASLKVFIENISINGLTFGYNGGKHTRIINAQKMVYITSAGGYIGRDSSLELYLRELCALFCIPQIKFIKADGLDIVSADVQTILDKTVKNM